MFKTLEYLKFLFSATNQHGVHSPFVYDYVTKCLYTKSPYRQTKSMAVFLKSLAYFEVRAIGLSPSKESARGIIQREFPEIQINVERNDAAYLDISDFESGLSFESLNIHNHSIGFVDSIYRNRQYKNVWEELKKSPHITVTVDLFHCGIVFFRKEQAKEHFRIRI